jgi:hypothetical protein
VEALRHEGLMYEIDSQLTSERDRTCFDDCGTFPPEPLLVDFSRLCRNVVGWTLSWHLTGSNEVRLAIGDSSECRSESGYETQAYKHAADAALTTLKTIHILRCSSYPSREASCVSIARLFRKFYLAIFITEFPL